MVKRKSDRPPAATWAATILLAAIVPVSPAAVTPGADSDVNPGGAKTVRCNTAEGSMNSEQFETAVKNYLLSHTEILMEAMALGQQKLASQKKVESSQAIKDKQADLLYDAHSPVHESVKESDTALTVVEFFDYRCSYCKRAAVTVNAMLASNPDVRLVYKEYPILGPDSLAAAKAALAANKQGFYDKFHEALLQMANSPNQADLTQLAQRLGLDLTLWKADMEAPDIAAEIERTRSLAQAIGAQGTPTFVIGTEVVSAAMDAASFQSMISQAQKLHIASMSSQGQATNTIDTMNKERRQ